jgi:hypothetical protein
MNLETLETVWRMGGLNERLALVDQGKLALSSEEIGAILREMSFLSSGIWAPMVLH